MKIPRCAPSWLMNIAHDLVKAGSENPGVANLSWIPNWNIALHWIQQPGYGVLDYHGDTAVDDMMQKQILDALSRASQKKLVTIENQTPTSAVCFFGGAPADIKLDGFDIKNMNINRPPND